MKKLIMIGTVLASLTSGAGADEWYKRSEKKEEFYRSTPKVRTVPLREPEYVLLREPEFVEVKPTVSPSLRIRQYKFGILGRPKRITEYRFYEVD